MPNDPSDIELVHRAKTGDLAAFEALTLRYERQVYSLALRMLRNEHDAQDITQEAFLSAMENLHAFREESTFSTWLMRIAAHAAIKILRKSKRFVSLEETTEPADSYDSVPHPEFIADWRQSPDRLANQHETRQIIEQALDQLDDKHRPVFLLRDVEGLSIQETAEALQLSPANVKVRLLRARLQLRESLTRAFGDSATRREPHKHQ